MFNPKIFKKMTTRTKNEQTGNSTNKNTGNGTLVEGTKRVMVTGKNGCMEENFIPVQIRVYPPITEQHKMVISC